MLALALALLVTAWLLLYSAFTGASPLEELRAAFGGRG